MLKRFFKKHRTAIVFYLWVILTFAFVFVLGIFCGRAFAAKTDCTHSEPASVESNTESTTASDAIFTSYISDAPAVAVDQAQGVDQARETSADDPEAHYKEITVTATAYCPCADCSGGWGNRTSTGKTATAGRTIAVDPSIIPYGTGVIIEGVTYIAEDCGGAINGNRVDIFFNTHEEAMSYGRRVVTAYILK